MAAPLVRPPPGAIPPGAIPAGMQPGGPPPMQVPINPALQSLLDSLPHTETPFTLITAPIPNTQPPQTNTMVVCPAHKQSICEACGVNFNDLNYMHQFLRSAPAEAIPPPPNVQPPPQRAEMIKAAKEQGNVSPPFLSSHQGRRGGKLTTQNAFKGQNFPLAIQHYSRSADMALSRPPWELAAVSRDETAIALCNRSAAFAFAGAW